MSVVLGTLDRKRYLKATIESIRNELDASDIKYEIIVVDGGSRDGTRRWLSGQKDIVTINQAKTGKRSWGYFMNLGFKCAQGKYVCMISDDCLIVPGAIRNGYALFEHEEQNRTWANPLGAVAFFFRDWPDDEFYKVYTVLDRKLSVNHGIYLKRALEDARFCDEDTFRFYAGDCDLSLKIWNAGYEILASPYSFIEHFNYANILLRAKNRSHINDDNIALMKKWAGVYENPRTDGGVGLPIENRFVDLNGTARTFYRLNPLYELWIHIVPRKYRTQIVKYIKDKC